MNRLFRFLLRRPRDLSAIIDVKWNTQLIRVVPGVDRLICLRVELPPDQWDELLNAVRSWPDVEITPGRIVRRGKKNRATNIFIDLKEKTLQEIASDSSIASEGTGAKPGNGDTKK